MKKLGGLLVILIILVVGLTLTKNIMARTGIVTGVKAITGLEMQLDSVNVGVLKPVLGLNGLKILNPSGFDERVMADFPEIFAHYDLGGFLKGKVHFEELRINLAELIVVKNKNNQVNINSLKSLMPPKGGGGKPPEIRIDALNLKIGKVIYKYFVLGKEQLREFNINMDENFKDITDPKALANLILVKALSKTTIPSLANIDLGGLKSQLSGAVTEQAQGMVQNVKEKATETLMQTEGAVQKFFQPKK